jgi:hypothetical protein
MPRIIEIACAAAIGAGLLLGVEDAQAQSNPAHLQDALDAMGFTNAGTTTAAYEYGNFVGNHTTALIGVDRFVANVQGGAAAAMRTPSGASAAAEAMRATPAPSRAP